MSKQRVDGRSKNKQYFCKGSPEGSCGVPILAKSIKPKHTGLCRRCNIRKISKEYWQRQREKKSKTQ